MKNVMRIMALLLFTVVNSLVADTIIIDQPGFISLGDDIVELLGVDVIQITSSSVTLDLQEHIIAGGINGIVIDPNLSNVIIRNGTISSNINHGISIGQNCSSIQIKDVNIASSGGNGIHVATGVKGVSIGDCFLSGITAAAISVAENTSNIAMRDLNITNCGGPAVELLGTSTADRVQDMLLEKVSTSLCSLSETFSHVFCIRNGENIVMRGIGISNGGNLLSTMRLVEFENCDRCILNTALIAGNSGGSLTGVSFINTQSSVCQLCTVINNEALTGKFKGFNLKNNSVNNFFVQCRVLTSSSASDNANRGLLLKCIASYNSSSAGMAIGLRFTSVGGDGWLVNKCNFVRNLGSSDINSFGVKLENGTANAFTKNVAFDNGVIASNQMNGVPSGSVTQLNYSNLNTADSPWANIVVTAQ